MRIAAFEGAPTDTAFDRFVIFLRKHTRNVSPESSIKREYKTRKTLKRFYLFLYLFHTTWKSEY